MDFRLALFGFDGMYHIYRIPKFIIEGDRLPFGRFYLIIKMDVWGLVQNKTVEHLIEPCHKTDQVYIGTDSKSNPERSRDRRFHLRDQMGLGNVQYDIPIGHSLGFKISVVSPIPFGISTRSKFWRPTVTSTAPSGVNILFPSKRYSLGMVRAFSFSAIMIFPSPDNPGYSLFGGCSNLASTLKV